MPEQNKGIQFLYVCVLDKRLCDHSLLNKGEHGK